MQSHYPRSFISDHLHPLQPIFEEVWRELKDNGTFGPVEDQPKTAHGKMTYRVMRYEIACQVMSCAENGQMTDREIGEATVKGMSLTYRTSRGPASLRQRGKALRRTSAKTPTVVR